jgi:hypothetical protein
MLQSANFFLPDLPMCDAANLHKILFIKFRQDVKNAVDDRIDGSLGLAMDKICDTQSIPLYGKGEPISTWFGCWGSDPGYAGSSLFHTFCEIK